MRGRCRILWVAALCLGVATAAWAERPVYFFSVLNQRSPTLTAQYWNPILAYISKKTEVDLKLKIGKTALATTDLTARGEAQFAYSNQLFAPAYARLGWHVIARADGAGVRGQIVVAADSPVRTLQDLQGRKVAFSSEESFIGHQLPLRALQRERIAVQARFSSNAEGALGLLKSGRVVAACADASVLAAYGRRESLAYRVLWTSEPFVDLPILGNPSFVPEETIQAVRNAFLNMRRDSEGLAILAAGARLLGLAHPGGFVSASDEDYDAYRAFYRGPAGKRRT